MECRGLQEQILVVTLLNLLEAQLKPVLGEEGKAASMKPSDVDAAVQNIFLFSLVWSAGGSLTDASRSEFDQQLRLYLDQKYDFPHCCIRFMHCCIAFALLTCF